MKKFLEKIELKNFVTSKSTNNWEMWINNQIIGYIQYDKDDITGSFSVPLDSNMISLLDIPLDNSYQINSYRLIITPDSKTISKDDFKKIMHLSGTNGLFLRNSDIYSGNLPWNNNYFKIEDENIIIEGEFDVHYGSMIIKFPVKDVDNYCAFVTEPESEEDYNQLIEILEKYNISLTLDNNTISSDFNSLNESKHHWYVEKYFQKFPNGLSSFDLINWLKGSGLNLEEIELAFKEINKRLNTN